MTIGRLIKGVGSGKSEFSRAAEIEAHVELALPSNTTNKKDF
jgi:hypothetical protein